MRGISSGYRKSTGGAIAKALEKAKNAGAGAIGGVKKYHGEILEENKKRWSKNMDIWELSKARGGTVTDSSGRSNYERKRGSLLGALKAAKAGGLAGLKK